MKPKAKSPPRKPIKKILWSFLGSFLGIFFVAFLCHFVVFGEKNTLFLIGSFGASAVLLYGAPIAEFSQPRNVIGGHVLSALVGVTVFLLLGQHVMLAAALAVSLSIGVMHLTRTLHPPGGATALIAVIGDRVHSLGYYYVLNPVLVGALAMLLVALVVNNFSTNSNRHYPVYWV